MENIITLTDSYKFTHHRMYPPGTEKVHSYFEARTGATHSYTVFVGLQYILKRFLVGEVVTRAKIEAAAELSKKHFGADVFNRPMWEHILATWGGRLPLTIRAVPEGMVVPNSNVLMTVENNDPMCAPLTNHVETILSHVWFPSTVATVSRKIKECIARFLDDTADSRAGLDFMLHDFGFRGTSSVESAGIGGFGHLVNFKGTDTVRAIEIAMEHYGSDVCAFSIPATEHSVMTSLGPDGEETIFSDLLSQFPAGPLAIASDSYDIFRACSEIIGGKLKDRILTRDGVIVVRPDSGDPVSTMLRVIEILAARFGASPNSKGFLVMNPKVRTLWGDGLEYDGIYNILRALKESGWSASNVAGFGMGGGLLQKVNRDTQRFAFKCSAQYRDGKWVDIYKDPVDKTKASKRGRLALTHDATGFHTVPYPAEHDLLKVVFKNGWIPTACTLDSIRANAAL